jgi:hypothetical protein
MPTNEVKINKVVSLGNYNPQLASPHYDPVFSLSEFTRTAKVPPIGDAFESVLTKLRFNFDNITTDRELIFFIDNDEKQIIWRSEVDLFAKYLSNNDKESESLSEEEARKILSEFHAILVFKLNNEQFSKLQNDLKIIVDKHNVREKRLSILQGTEKELENVSEERRNEKFKFLKSIYEEYKSKVTLEEIEALQVLLERAQLTNAFVIRFIVPRTIADVMFQANYPGCGAKHDRVKNEVTFDLNEKKIITHLKSSDLTLSFNSEVVEDTQLFKSESFYPLLQGKANFAFEMSFDKTNPTAYIPKLTKVEFIDASQEYRALVMMSLFFGKEINLEEKGCMEKIKRFIKAESIVRQELQARDEDELDFCDEDIRQRVLLRYQLDNDLYTEKQNYGLGRLAVSWVVLDEELSAIIAIDALEGVAVKTWNTKAIALVIKAKNLITQNDGNNPIPYKEIKDLCDKGSRYLLAPIVENIPQVDDQGSQSSETLAAMRADLLGVAKIEDTPKSDVYVFVDPSGESDTLFKFINIDTVCKDLNIPDEIASNPIFIQALKGANESESMDDLWENILDHLQLACCSTLQKQKAEELDAEELIAALIKWKGTTELIAALIKHKLKLLDQAITAVPVEGALFAEHAREKYEEYNASQEQMIKNPASFDDFCKVTEILEATLLPIANADLRTAQGVEALGAAIMNQTVKSLKVAASLSNKQTALLIVGIVAVSLVTVAVMTSLSLFCPPVGLAALGLGAALGIKLGLVGAAGLATAYSGAGMLGFAYKKMTKRDSGQEKRGSVSGSSISSFEPVSKPEPKTETPTSRRSSVSQ